MTSVDVKAAARKKPYGDFRAPVSREERKLYYRGYISLARLRGCRVPVFLAIPLYGRLKRKSQVAGSAWFPKWSIVFRRFSRGVQRVKRAAHAAANFQSARETTARYRELRRAEPRIHALPLFYLASSASVVVFLRVHRGFPSFRGTWKTCDCCARYRETRRHFPLETSRLLLIMARTRKCETWGEHTFQLKLFFALSDRSEC